MIHIEISFKLNFINVSDGNASAETRLWYVTKVLDAWVHEVLALVFIITNNICMVIREVMGMFSKYIYYNGLFSYIYRLGVLELRCNCGSFHGHHIATRMKRNNNHRHRPLKRLLPLLPPPRHTFQLIWSFPISSPPMDKRPEHLIAWWSNIFSFDEIDVLSPFVLSPSLSWLIETTTSVDKFSTSKVSNVGWVNGSVEQSVWGRFKEGTKNCLCYESHLAAHSLLR